MTVKKHRAIKKMALCFFKKIIFRHRQKTKYQKLITRITFSRKLICRSFAKLFFIKLAEIVDITYSDNACHLSYFVNASLYKLPRLHKTQLISVFHG